MWQRHPVPGVLRRHHVVSVASHAVAPRLLARHNRLAGGGAHRGTAVGVRKANPLLRNSVEIGSCINQRRFPARDAERVGASLVEHEQQDVGLVSIRRLLREGWCTCAAAQRRRRAGGATGAVPAPVAQRDVGHSNARSGTKSPGRETSPRVFGGWPRGRGGRPALLLDASVTCLHACPRGWTGAWAYSTSTQCTPTFMRKPANQRSANRGGYVEVASPPLAEYRTRGRAPAAAAAARELAGSQRRSGPTGSIDRRWWHFGILRSWSEHWRCAE